jgi:hypothetical protein
MGTRSASFTSLTNNLRKIASGIVQRGKSFVVVRVGLMGFGWSLFALMTLFRYYSHGIELPLPWELGWLVIYFALCCIAGYIYGQIMWFSAKWISPK